MKKKIFWTVIFTLLFGSLLTYFICNAVDFINAYSVIKLHEYITSLYWDAILYLIDGIFSVVLGTLLLAIFVILITSLYKSFSLSKTSLMFLSVITIDLYIFMYLLNPIFSMLKLSTFNFSCYIIALPLLIVCITIIFGYFIRKEWQKLKAEKNKSTVDQQTPPPEED